MIWTNLVVSILLLFVVFLAIRIIITRSFFFPLGGANYDLVKVKGWKAIAIGILILFSIGYFLVGSYFGFITYRYGGGSITNPVIQKELINFCDRNNCDPETQNSVDLMKKDYYKKEWFYNEFPWLYR